MLNIITIDLIRDSLAWSKYLVPSSTFWSILSLYGIKWIVSIRLLQTPLFLKSYTEEIWIFFGSREILTCTSSAALIQASPHEPWVWSNFRSNTFFGSTFRWQLINPINWLIGESDLYPEITLYMLLWIPITWFLLPSLWPIQWIKTKSMKYFKSLNKCAVRFMRNLF